MSEKDAKQPQSLKPFSAVFIDSVPFGGEAQSVQLGRNCESLMEVERGLLIAAKRKEGGKTVLRRSLVPWANVRAIDYEPIDL